MTVLDEIIPRLDYFMRPEMGLGGACPCPHCGSLYQLGDSQEVLGAAEPQLKVLYVERLPVYEGRRLVRMEDAWEAEEPEEEEEEGGEGRGDGEEEEELAEQQEQEDEGEGEEESDEEEMVFAWHAPHTFETLAANVRCRACLHSFSLELSEVSASFGEVWGAFTFELHAFRECRALKH